MLGHQPGDVAERRVRGDRQHVPSHDLSDAEAPRGCRCGSPASTCDHVERGDDAEGRSETGSTTITCSTS